MTENLSSLVGMMRGLQMVDLSHTLEEGIPVWPTHARFGHVLYESYELGDPARQYGLMLGEHTGTHMGRPAALYPGRSGPLRHRRGPTRPARGPGGGGRGYQRPRRTAFWKPLISRSGKRSTVR